MKVRNIGAGPYSQICSFGCLYEKGPPKADLKTLAEGEGFEPSLPGVPVKRFSRPPHSAALPPFQNMYQPPKELVKKKAPKTGAFEKSLAERWGFEPQIRFWRIHDFQSCTFGQLGHLSACLQTASLSRFLSCAHSAVKYFTPFNTNSQEKNTHCFCHFLQLAAAHRTASSSSGRSAYPPSLHQRIAFPP